MPSPQELGLVERFLGTFPNDVMRCAQLVGVIRVISHFDGVSAEQIVDELDRDESYLPIIGCDDNGGVPKVADVIADLNRMEAAGFAVKDGDKWSFTADGTKAIVEYDLRYSPSV